MTELLVSPQAFADYRSKAYDPTDFYAVKALEVASDFARAESGQHFTIVEDDEVELEGNWTRRLRLPQRPVTSLGAVSVRRVGWLTFQTMTGLTVNRRGLVLAYGWDWGGPEATIRVTYSHGSDDLPPGVQGIVCAIAARRIGDPTAGATRAETIGGYSYVQATGADGDPILITTDELRTLHNIRAITLQAA